MICVECEKEVLRAELQKDCISFGAAKSGGGWVWVVAVTLFQC